MKRKQGEERRRKKKRQEGPWGCGAGETGGRTAGCCLYLRCLFSIAMRIKDFHDTFASKYHSQNTLMRWQRCGSPLENSAPAAAKGANLAEMFDRHSALILDATSLVTGCGDKSCVTETFVSLTAISFLSEDHS